MLEVHYDANSSLTAIADGKALEYAREVVDRERRWNTDPRTAISIRVSTEIAIYAFRILVKRGVIDPSNIVFVHDLTGEHINVDRDGRLDYWPEGFCDTWDKMLDELIGSDHE